MKTRSILLSFPVAVLVFSSFNAAATTYRVTADVVTEGDGQSWASPMSITNAVASATTEDDVILCKAGEYTVGQQIVIATPITVSGGLAGTDDTTLAADPVSTFNALDNSAFQSMFVVSTATGADTTNLFERITFTRGYTRGLYKSGAANISFKDCRFCYNGVRYTVASAYSGAGVYISGTSAVEARFESCLFDGNARTSYVARTCCIQGGGAYVTGMKRVYFDDCTFLTNCVSFDTSFSANNQIGQDAGEGGGAIWAYNQPVTLRNCLILANRTPGRDYGGSYRGAALRITGASGGSAITNCVFAGNESTYTTTSPMSIGGAIGVWMSDPSYSLDIYGSTIAYNYAYGGSTAAGVAVYTGTLKVRDSIIYGNMVGSTHTSGYGRDVVVYAGGYLDIDYSLVTAEGMDYLSNYTAGHLALGDHTVYGDPRFGTNLTQVAALMTGANGAFKLAAVPAILAFDLHEGAGSGGYSRAIDTGDPATAYANEPAPNGSRVNLGVYGNTSAAATSMLGTPSISNDTINIVFAGDTKPTVSFTLGGSTDYNAQVSIEVATNDFELGGVNAHESVSLGGRQIGDEITLACIDLYQPGSTVYVRVTIAAPGGEPIVAYAHATVTGTLPAYYGHGGGANVMHVREGASGYNTGENWTDAYPDLNSALAAMTAEKTELWIAGTIVPTLAPVTFTASAALNIRGGFVGTEDSVTNRVPGACSSIDGNYGYDGIVLVNDAAYPVYVERMTFERAIYQAFKKTGTGNIDFNDCRFHYNGRYSDTSGRGVSVSGSASSTYASFTNCQFLGNMKINGGSSASQGCAIYAANLKRITADDCTFVTNGVSPTGGIGSSICGRDQCNGACVWLSSAPATMRNCRFTANRGGIRSATGGIFLLENACGGSAFTNCVWFGSQDTYAESDITSHTGTRGGTVVVSLSSTAYTVDFENCTIAYNLGDAQYCPGGLDVQKGTVNVHNSIIYGNRRGSVGKVGSDISVLADGILNLSYVRLTEEGLDGKPTTNTVSEVTADSISYDNISYGASDFITSESDFASYLRTSGSLTYLLNTTVGAAFLSAMDAHLLSKQGYWDNALVFHDDTNVVSSCIDAGDPSSDYAAEPYPNGHRVNLGAYGNTPYASLSPRKGMIVIMR